MRARATAQATALSLEEVLTQSIARSLPLLEADLPAHLRSDLAMLSVLSEGELEAVAQSVLDDARQGQLQVLAEANKQGPLSLGEQRQLAQLMHDAERLMLRKAAAQRLLAGRGHAPALR